MPMLAKMAVKFNPMPNREILYIKILMAMELLMMMTESLSAMLSLI